MLRRMAWVDSAHSHKGRNQRHAFRLHERHLPGGAAPAAEMVSLEAFMESASTLSATVTGSRRALWMPIQGTAPSLGKRLKRVDGGAACAMERQPVGMSS